MIDTTGKGVVLASYGRGVLVQPDWTAPGAAPPGGVPPLRCSLKGRKQRIVCGDRITWVYEPANDGASVESIEPRRNLIERIDLRGRAEPVAANIDRLAIVVAAEPAADWFLVDRYWAGARLKDITSSWLIVNKSDLGLDAIRQEIEIYRGLGLPCLETTIQSADGIERLRSVWAGGVTLLVGQSGVGKSSIVNALAPEAAAQTSELTRDAEGRHTTTTARRYSLGPETAIVDAPGVRDFAPPAIRSVSSPLTRTAPEVGSSRVPAIVSSEDLPDPDGPITATISPAATVRDTSRSACTSAAPRP